MRGFVVGIRLEVDGEIWLHVETTVEVVGVRVGLTRATPLTHPDGIYVEAVPAARNRPIGAPHLSTVRAMPIASERHPSGSIRPCQSPGARGVSEDARGNR